MSVWYSIPSARPPAEANLALSKWRERGYKIALWRDSDQDVPICDLLLTGDYPGYAAAVNALVKEVLARDPQCLWIVAGGDDTGPDLNHSPEDIATDCALHFGCTFGVMQPTGHRWPNNHEAYIDRVAGSPWIGREWCERAHHGRGPLHPDFTHMYVDEALQCAAQKLGVFWQRRDLIHFHNHWALKGNHSNMPEFLKKSNTQDHWRESKAIFDRIRTGGFAECLPTQ